MEEAGIHKSEGLALADAVGVWRASDAVLRVFRHLPGLWPLAWILVVVPHPWRDAAYRFVARRRYAWFGCTACRVTASAGAAQSNGE